MTKMDKRAEIGIERLRRPQTSSFAARCVPPVHNNRLVERPRLTSRLNEALSQHLIRIVAPPGFGKTTLLAEWWEQLRQRADITAVWLTLDATPLQVAELDRDLAKAFQAALGSPSDLPENGWLEQAWRNAENGRKPVLILDGLDKADAACFKPIVEAVAGQSGLPLTIAMATRHRGFVASELDARGLATQLDAADLAMSSAEVAMLLHGMLSDENAAVVNARTEGWPVAIQAYRHLLIERRHGDMLMVPLERLVGKLAPYIDQQVLGPLAPDIQAFGEDTSILRQFDPLLANAIRQKDDAHAMIAGLDDLRGLIVPADAVGKSLRYGQLLREHLQTRLLRRGSERTTALHRQAALYLSGQGRLVEAVFHARETGDKQLATRLVAQAGGWKLIVEFGHGFAQGLLELFDASDIRQSLELLIVQAYLQMRSGDVAASRHSLDICSALAVNNDHSGHDLEIMEILFRNYAHAPIDSGWRDRVAAVVSHLTLGDNVGRGIVLMCSANVELDLGDFERAEAEAKAAIGAMRLAGSGVGERYCEVMLAQSLMHRGRLKEADSLFKRIISEGMIEYGRGSNSAALGSGLRAAIVALRGDREAAQSLLSEAQEILEGVEGWADVLASMLRTQFEIEVRTNGQAGGQATLKRARHIATKRSLPLLSELADAWELELMATFGDAGGASEFVRAKRLRQAFEAAELPFAWRTREALGFSLARWHLVESRSAAALTLLNGLKTNALKNGRMLDVARIDMAVAAACRRRGENGAMLKHIELALLYIEQQDAPMLAFEMGLQSEALLQSFVAGRKAPDRLRQLAQQILKDERRAESLDTSGLSNREIDILQQLCLGQSNKEIGWKLSLSENTVKFHLKRIYAKLGVSTRSGAVAMATDRGLLGEQSDREGSSLA